MKSLKNWQNKYRKFSMTDSMKGTKILIAEDDLISRLMLISALKRWDYEPVVVTNGKEALEILLQEDSPLLAILDWIMPEMDGIDVIKTLQKEKPESITYMIILTSKTEKDDVICGLEAGAHDYIRKPFDIDELWARIRVDLRTATLQKELLETQKILEYKAVHDPLTDCLNRRGILERLEEEIERSLRSGSQFCVALCDLDHFKKVNDTYGHQIGDNVLKYFVQIIYRQLRPYDQLGRLGGEEFLIIIPDISDADAVSTLERLRHSVQEAEIDTYSEKLKITVSIGGIIVKGKDNMDNIIKIVDDTMYTAKEKGRNQVYFGGVE